MGWSRAKQEAHAVAVGEATADRFYTDMLDPKNCGSAFTVDVSKFYDEID